MMAAGKIKTFRRNLVSGAFAPGGGMKVAAQNRGTTG